VAVGSATPAAVPSSGPSLAAPPAGPHAAELLPAGTSAIAPAAFVGPDVAVSRFIPNDPARVVSPVFALNYGGAEPETQPALGGLDVAGTHRAQPNTVRIASPVFFGLDGLELGDGLAGVGGS
jgi:hypothetical protein